VQRLRHHLHGRLRKARPKLEDSSKDKTLGVSSSPAPAARPWWQRHPYLVSLVPALVILTVCVAAHDVVMDASNGTPTGFADTINIVASAGVLVLYGVLVAAALVSLAMPRLRHSYARGLWTAVLLIPFILVAAVGMGLVAFGGD
jgi:hypothetical protein